jgi:hypothetical protein
MFVNLVHVGYWKPFFFVTYEQPKVLLRAVEMKSTDRLAIIVVKQHTAVAMHVTQYDTLRCNYIPQDSFHCVVGFHFLYGSYDPISIRLRLICLAVA